MAPWWRSLVRWLWSRLDVLVRAVQYTAIDLSHAPMTLLLVRHGESTHNVSAVHAYGDSGADDALFDAPLTAEGARQAAALEERFAREPVELVLVSPLTRAVQTYLGAFPPGGRRAHPPPRVEVCALAREHLTDSCDIGSAPAELQARFPTLDFAQLPPVWWYVDDETSTTDARDSRVRYAQFGLIEPELCFLARVDEFAAELQRRPERRVAVFGHSDFLNALLERHLGTPDRWLANGEVVEALLQPAAPAPGAVAAG